MRRFYPGKTLNKLVKYTKDFVKNAKRKKVVLGISGGLDSSVLCSILTSAMGSKNVTPLLMPVKYRPNDPDIIDAMKIIKKNNLKHKVISIGKMLKVFENELKINNRLRLGNIMARIRMIILYHIAKKERALVAGTSNKTERLLGYTTLWGDMAADFLPIANLYKTEIRALAAYLEIPESIINKPPTAGLWKKQTDEGELGFTYADADQILYYYLDRKYSKKRIQELGIPVQVINKVIKRYKDTGFKRELLPFPK